MKYLFLIQGDGRGHLTQAITLSALLRKNGHEVVGVLVGKSRGREIPRFFYDKIAADVALYETPSFIFKKNGKQVHMLKTISYNCVPKRLKRYRLSMRQINDTIERLQPDVVVNFYELLAGLCHLRYQMEVPFVNIGHQFLTKHRDYPFAKGDDQRLFFFRFNTLICGLGATKTLALSFYPMKDYLPERIAVVPPLLRRELFETTPSDGDFVLGYMLNQGYEEEVRAWHRQNSDEKLYFFWDKAGVEPTITIDDTFTLHSIDDKLFLEKMAACKAFISTAGFESICEAYYLGKPVMLIPAHIEQNVNAQDAASVGIGIIGERFDIGELLAFTKQYQRDNAAFRTWVESAEEQFIRHLTTLV